MAVHTEVRILVFSLWHFNRIKKALHWRYDRKDFLSISRCAKFSRIIRDTSILTYEKACHLFLPIFARPAGFADDIVRTLRKQKLKHIYIAAPPSEQVFIDDLSEELEKRKIHVLTYQQVKQFFDQNYPNCDHFKVSHFAHKIKPKIGKLWTKTNAYRV